MIGVDTSRIFMVGDFSVTEGSRDVIGTTVSIPTVGVQKTIGADLKSVSGVHIRLSSSSVDHHEMRQAYR